MNWRGVIARHPPLLELPAIPYASYLYCPICGKTIHAHLPTDLRHPDDIADQAEVYAREHFRRNHSLRLRLYDSLGWRWPIAGWNL